MRAVDHELAKHPFLDGLSNKHLQLLATCAMPTAFASGEVFYHEGDPANRFYLIAEGEVALELDVEGQKPLLVQTVGVGETVGWSWMIQPYRAHLTARTLTPVKAVFFYGTRLLEACEEDHELGYEMMKRVATLMAHRLEAVMHRLAIERQL